jgi:hypothetical protein
MTDSISRLTGAATRQVTQVDPTDPALRRRNLLLGLSVFAFVGLVYAMAMVRLVGAAMRHAP